MAELVFLFLIGLVGGFLAGLIGIGGGVMYVLVLPYLLIQMGFPEQEMVQYIIANSLFGTMSAALAGNVALMRRGEFYPKPVFIIGVFAALCSFLMLFYFVNTSAYDITQFNIVVIFLMLLIVWKTLRQNKSESSSEEKRISRLGLSALGVSAGTVSSLSGLGGGVIVIPILNSGLKMSMTKAKSISLGVIFVSSLVATIVNMSQQTMTEFANQSTGYIVWPLAIAISAGVIIASPLGVVVAAKLSNRRISYIFVAFVGVVIIDKIIQLI